MSTEDRGLFGEEQSSISVKELFFKYLSKWPFILICLIICVGVGILFIRYSTPKYMATTSFLVKDQAPSISSDLVDAAISGTGRKEISLNNEILQFSSTTLMESTVEKYGFNISYFKKGRVLDIDIYQDAPFKLIPKNITESSQAYTMYISDITNIGGKLTFDADGEGKKHDFSWNALNRIESHDFILMSDQNIVKDEAVYLLKWEPVSSAASQLSNNLEVQAQDPKTSVISLSLKSTNLKKGTDILNALFAEYNRFDIEDRSKLSENTVKFIDDRLLIISNELRGVEGNLENYQGSNNLVDMQGQSSMSLENSNTASKTAKNLAVQQNVITIIERFFADPANSNKLVPSSLGLTDGTISALVTQYNLLQLKRERVAPLVAPNSTVMQDLKSQLATLKSSIIESLGSIKTNLQLQESSIQTQNNQYKNFLSSVPRNERVLQEIKRKQGITEGLYLYLLQKREEAAISSTGNSVPSYKQIDLAKGFGPVEPNPSKILLYTFLLGLTLSFGGIYVRDLFNDTISSRQEITRKLTLPMIGDINHIPKRKKLPISVLTLNITSEQFRAIRTNLSFTMKDQDQKVILVTSSINGEGKSFISSNLAAIFALPGKKVALLEFDIRKPTIATNLDLVAKKGLTNYLSGDEIDLTKISQPFKEINNLHIYPAGPLPANPGDMLVSENLAKLFANLREKYDYVIVDSPPAKLVSDSFILGKYSDAVMYIIRDNYTLTKQLTYIKEIVANKTLKNINIIYNDVKTSGKTAYDGYYGDRKS